MCIVPGMRGDEWGGGRGGGIHAACPSAAASYLMLLETRQNLLNGNYS